MPEGVSSNGSARAWGKALRPIIKALLILLAGTAVLYIMDPVIPHDAVDSDVATGDLGVRVRAEEADSRLENWLVMTPGLGGRAARVFDRDSSFHVISDLLDMMGKVAFVAGLLLTLAALMTAPRRLRADREPDEPLLHMVGLELADLVKHGFAVVVAGAALTAVVDVDILNRYPVDSRPPRWTFPSEAILNGLTDSLRQTLVQQSLEGRKQARTLARTRDDSISRQAIRLSRRLESLEQGIVKSLDGRLDQLEKKSDVLAEGMTTLSAQLTNQTVEIVGAIDSQGVSSAIEFSMADLRDTISTQAADQRRYIHFKDRRHVGTRLLDFFRGYRGPETGE